MKRSILKMAAAHAHDAAPAAGAPPFRLFASKDAAASFGIGVGVFLDFSWIIILICVICTAINIPTTIVAARHGAPRSILALATFAGTANGTRISDTHVASDLCITLAIAVTAVLCAFLFAASATAADMAAQTAADYSVKLTPAADAAGSLHSVAHRVRAAAAAILAEHGGAQCVANLAIHAHEHRTNCVIVTLHTETQRAALLSFYTRGALCSRGLRKHGADPVYTWAAEEAHEPSDIIWKNAHRSAKERYARAAASFALCSATTGVAFAAINSINPETKSPTIAGIAAGITIAVINGMLPSVAFVIAQLVERPATHSEKQALQLYKLTAIRIFNSAFMIFFLTPNSAFLSSNTQEQIAAVILIDAAISIVGRATRPLAAIATIVARQKSPARPIRWSLPDRYADIIKFFTVAAAFSYTAPMTYLVAALAIAAGRAFDAYDISHRWAVPPKTNNALAAIALHFIALAGLAHAWIALWAYQRWPFDAAVDRHKSPFRHDARGYVPYAYYGFMIAFVCIIAADIFKQTIAAGIAHICCGRAQRRRPLSTQPFSREKHGQYSPEPGALFEYSV
jgi:hypothetical protein